MIKVFLKKNLMTFGLHLEKLQIQLKFFMIKVFSKMKKKMIFGEFLEKLLMVLLSLSNKVSLKKMKMDSGDLFGKELKVAFKLLEKLVKSILKLQENQFKL